MKTIRRKIITQRQSCKFRRAQEGKKQEKNEDLLMKPNRAKRRSKKKTKIKTREK